MLPEGEITFAMTQFEGGVEGDLRREPSEGGRDSWTLRARDRSGRQVIERSGASLSYEGHERLDLEWRTDGAYLRALVEVRENELADGSTSVRCTASEPILLFPSAPQGMAPWAGTLQCSEPPHRHVTGRVVDVAPWREPGRAPSTAIRLTFSYFAGPEVPRDPRPSMVWVFWPARDGLPRAYRTEYRTGAGYRIGFEGSRIGS